MNKNTFSADGNIIDIINRRIFWGRVNVADGFITNTDVIEDNERPGEPYILPGFIDSHVHIESSMLIPSEFARLAVLHGTTGTISDPHEIANVCGIPGVEFMINNGRQVPFKFHFGAPSCVPATSFETAGAALDANDVDALLQLQDIYYLSEMMNFPGVLNNDPEVLKKIASAKKIGKPVDGHAPGLMGDAATAYINAGISTDHECYTAEEALDKLSTGMKILIREGSAAKNFDALIGLVNDHWENMMFCSDDKHPDSLLNGHINLLCARAAAEGIDVFKILQAACINPVLHYKMRNGILRDGDPADMIIIRDLKNFEVLKTFIDGECVAEAGKSFISSVTIAPINQFDCNSKSPNDFELIADTGTTEINVIGALEGQLITNPMRSAAKIISGKIVSDIENDVLKIVVVNRYSNRPPAIAFIKNIGLKNGAIASSVAHDSHNIVAVGVDDESICRAVNAVIKHKGGISAVSETTEMILPLPVAGLMSTEDGFRIAKDYTAINDFAINELKSTMQAPFMTLSFMALLVIPSLKLSDKGLFDGDRFAFTNVQSA